MTKTTQPREQAANKELLEIALERARTLGTAGMKLTAHLCQLATYDIKGSEYVLRHAVMNGVVAWRNAFGSAPEIPFDAVRAALASPVAAPEAPILPLCPACQGSGEGLMMEGQGPDVYEVPCACPYCKGSGGLLDAYHGLVALLDAEREKYLQLCGKTFFTSTGAAPLVPEVAASEQQAGESTCAMCNDSGIVGYPPDQYEECPDCIKARAATTASTDHNSQDPNCSCPSGSGSLHYPCPIHPNGDQ